MPGQGEQAADVLEFWFGQSRPRQWFAKDAAFDALLRERFLGLTRSAIAGELSAWNAEPSGALALVLLLDQFPRQIWRDTAMAFSGDPQALALSLKAVELGWLEAEPEQARRQFWLMPLMHSEDLAVQEAALPLFERFSDPRTADFACRHRDVIARFGRFPHRNALLEGKDRALAAMAEVANDCAETPRCDGKGQHLGARWLQMAQSTSCSPFTRLNSLTLWLTTVAPMASAWQAIQRSLAPMGVARRFRAVA